MNKNLQKTVLAALLAALTCVATMVIQIPVVATGGYLHLGDGLVLICGWMLGPWYGALAAGIGSALADVLTGYMWYVPATFLIKGAVALVAALLLKWIAKNKKTLWWPCLVSSIPAQLVMSAGYFIYEAFLLSLLTGDTATGTLAAAVSALPFNLIQALAGVIIGTLLMPLLNRLKITA